jgi:predicted transcriptional regulator
MPFNQASDQTTVSNELRAWDLRCSGMTQARVAQTLGVSQATVSRWLARVERRELRRMSRRVRRAKALQSETLEHVVDEALQAWERSKLPRKRARRSSTSGVLDGTGNPAAVDATDVEQRDGDPAYLDAAMAALREHAVLWGLYATPPRGRPAGDGPGELTYSALAGRLQREGPGRGGEPGRDPGGAG